MTKFKRFRKFLRAYIRRIALAEAEHGRYVGYTKGISYANGFRAGEQGFIAPNQEFFGKTIWIVEYRKGYADGREHARRMKDIEYRLKNGRTD